MFLYCRCWPIKSDACLQKKKGKKVFDLRRMDAKKLIISHECASSALRYCKTIRQTDDALKRLHTKTTSIMPF